MVAKPLNEEAEYKRRGPAVAKHAFFERNSCVDPTFSLHPHIITTGSRLSDANRTANVHGMAASGAADSGQKCVRFTLDVHFEGEAEKSAFQDNFALVKGLYTHTG